MIGKECDNERWFSSKGTNKYEICMKLGYKRTSLRLSWELNLTSPNNRTGIEILFGKVTVDCQIGFREIKAFAFEKMCWEAPKIL